MLGRGVYGHPGPVNVIFVSQPTTLTTSIEIRFGKLKVLKGLIGDSGHADFSSGFSIAPCQLTSEVWGAKGRFGIFLFLRCLFVSTKT